MPDPYLVVECALMALVGAVFSNPILAKSKRKGQWSRPWHPGIDYYNLFEEMRVACHEVDVHGIIQRVNPAGRELLGMDLEELLGRHCSVLAAPGDPESDRGSVTQKLRGDGDIPVFPQRFTRADGKELMLEVHQNLLRDNQGNVVGLRTAFFNVTERHRAQEEQAQALQAAREATAMKSRFLANMSHEIRTPMNGVLGMIQLLLLTPLNREQYRYGEAVRSSAESLLTIINDILDFSKIEAGKLELECVPFDVIAEVEDSISLLSVRAHAKKIELNCHVHPGVPPELLGDPGRLRQVLTNLVGNAVKFTDRGEVAVHVEPHEETQESITLCFRVCDTGIGIPAEHHKRLFASFEQADSSTTRRFGGTGLGLAISKELVQMMGGEISFASDVGLGTTFSFTARFQKRPSTVGEIPAALPGEAHVLVVDHHNTNRSIARKLMESWGCRVEEATDAVQALRMLRQAAMMQDPFRLGLFEYQMPHMDGASLAQCIKIDPLLRDTVLVCLTSGLDANEVTRLRNAGFAAHLHKPLRQSQLYNVLMEALAPEAQGSDMASEPDAPPPEPISGNFGNVPILLVEDNDINRRVALGLLAKLGAQADPVSNGREALDAVKCKQYGLILMDVQMPEMDGLEATAAIRNGIPPARYIPIVAITANAMAGDREDCLAAGMDDYISKPLQLAELHRVLSRWVKS